MSIEDNITIDQQGQIRNRFDLPRASLEGAGGGIA